MRIQTTQQVLVWQIIGILQNLTRLELGNGVTIRIIGECIDHSLSSADPSSGNHQNNFRVRFNPIEKDLLCSTVSDRSIVLYDVRAPTPMKKVTLSMQSNGISWNPQEAMIFTVANEDNNLYSFDLRNVSHRFCVGCRIMRIFSSILHSKFMLITWMRFSTLIGPQLVKNWYLHHMIEQLEYSHKVKTDHVKCIT